MPPRRPKGLKPLKEHNQPINVLQTNRLINPEYQSTLKEVSSQLDDAAPVGVTGIRSLLDSDENSHPIPSTSAATTTDALGTAALYDELDSFRQRWKRELDQTKSKDNTTKLSSSSKRESSTSNNDETQSHSPAVKECQARVEKSDTDSYNEAKRLFLLAVSLEQDDLHHESIRYYKQAMHLHPNIERQIFKEQCEANAVANANKEKEHNFSIANKSAAITDSKRVDEDISLETKITQNLESDNRTNERFTFCRPTAKLKKDCLHISDLPRELILLIYRYVIGQELDLASLESVGLVCRGFFLLSREQSLWRSICRSVWDNDNEDVPSGLAGTMDNNKEKEPIDWRTVFIKKPRINYDGVYISRTRYIRQGDVGFQDLTYRPFHVVRYYRYLRFLPEHRVLILTTNEEPEKIVPIFRHATQAKQFSSELSILDGTYEFSSANIVTIVADKDCRASLNLNTTNSRRHAQFEWSRQTPLSQKFNMKFELKTVENKPYRNNVLKWLEYTILTRLETGQEITSFDLNADTFPSLVFSRVKRFNSRVTKPLAISH